MFAKLAPLDRHRWPVVVTALVGLAMTAFAFRFAVGGERTAYAEGMRGATENRYAALRREIDALLAALEQARLLAGQSIEARRRLVAEYSALVAPGGIIAGADWVEARECRDAPPEKSPQCRLASDARDTGAVTLARLPALSEGDAERAHLGAAIPFYGGEPVPDGVRTRAQRFSGVVIIRLSPRELLEQSISYLQPAGLHVIYYAENSEGALRPLAMHRSRLGGVLPPPGHMADFKRAWLAGGQSMELHCEPVRDWSWALISWRTWALLLAGLVSTSIGAAYVHWMQSRTRRISEVIHRRTARLRVANRAAKAASRAKSQFLANMSHELRTPIGAIVGMSEMLRVSSGTRMEQEAVEAIHNSARQLTHLVNNILDYSKLEAGHFRPTPVEFHPTLLITDLAATFASQARMMGLRLDTACDPALPPTVRADEESIRQILYNLLANALRFTLEGEIILSARVASPHAAPMLEFCVRDTGLGIGARDLERIFDAFVQADSSDTRRFGGTGLGLAICRQLAEGMHGQLGVDSEPGLGSSFWLRVPFESVDEPPLEATPAAVAAGPTTPAAPAPQPAAFPTIPAAPAGFATAPTPPAFPAPPTAPAAQSTPAPAEPAPPLPLARHLLLVEDNALNQVVLSRLLERLGYSVQVAANGRVALDCCTTHCYDAILMDCQMPELDGYDTTRAIRAMPGPVRATPIMGVTASAGERDRDRCLEAGMDAYLPKPVTLDALRRALDRLCGPPPPVSDTSATPPLPSAASR